MTNNGQRCIFPYTFYNKTYNECKKKSKKNEYECPTQIVKGKIVKWGVCDLDLPVNKIEQKQEDKNNSINNTGKYKF